MNNILQPVTFNGINIYPFHSKEQFLQYISKNKKIYIAINISKLYNTSKDLIDIINNNIGYPDGIGALLALKLYNHHVNKLPGCELWLDLINYLDKQNSYYLIGGTHKVLDRVKLKLNIDFPGTNIVGSSDGYSINSNKKVLIDDVVQKKPDVIFIATGSPKQEFLMQELYSLHPAVYLGLGGSFDIYTGKVKRAPNIILSLNLEWLYRWIINPIKRTRQNIIYSYFFIRLIITYFTQNRQNE